MIQILEPTRQVNSDYLLKTVKQILLEDIGFLNAIKDEEWIKDVEFRASEIKNFSHFAVIGIGGSSLGLKAIVQALDIGSNITFFETLDSYSFQKKFNKLILEDTHVVVISKSGNTIETWELLKLFEKEYVKKDLSFSKYFTCITEKRENPLFEFATKKGIPVLGIPLDLGGRYSVLSPVGMFITEALGCSTRKFLEGARHAIKDEGKVAYISAQLLESFKNEEWITNLWIYSERLALFGAWFEQLWAESLGKKLTLDNKPAPRVSTPNTLLGSQDQHSLLQQVMEGAKDKFTIFMRVGEEETLIANIGAIYKAQVFGVQKALSEVGAQSFQILLPRVSEKELGYMFVIWQLIVVTIAKSLNLNPFDQPGVERSKVLTKSLIS